MHVHVCQARHERHAGPVDDRRIDRDLTVASRHRQDPVALDRHDRTIDHTGVGHRQNANVPEHRDVIGQSRQSQRGEDN